MAFINYDTDFKNDMHYKKYIEKSFKELCVNGVVYVFNEEHIKQIKKMIDNQFNIKVTKVGMCYRLMKE